MNNKGFFNVKHLKERWEEMGRIIVAIKFFKKVGRNGKNYNSYKI